MTRFPLPKERGQTVTRRSQDIQTTSEAAAARANFPEIVAKTLPEACLPPLSEEEERRMRVVELLEMTEKDTHATLICQKWHLTSLDAFFNHPISAIDPDLKSSVRLKPAHYSEHLVRKLWYIARETDVPPDRARRMLAQAVFSRLNDQGNKRNIHITVQDVDRVTKKIVSSPTLCSVSTTLF